ncbi:hypothetical protein I4I88_11150 [Corynebacterium diphtheriae bv. gravis]|nr:hypothetical protein [Corynebacterium diphtheriae bv. gravis]MBG9353038.1 hypothetical protein [Corynebacterium diphtheriae bv. gravis]
MNGLFTNNEYSKATETCYHMRLKPLDSKTNNAYRRQELDLNRTAQEFIDPLTGVFSYPPVRNHDHESVITKTPPPPHPHPGTDHGFT